MLFLLQLTSAACCFFLNGRLAIRYLQHILSKRDAYAELKTKLRPANNLIVESRYTRHIDRGLEREMASRCILACCECLPSSLAVGYNAPAAGFAGFSSVKNNLRITSITRPPSSLTEGRRYVTDGVRLAQRPHRGASQRLR
jgi:hypothetical protein